MALDIDKIRSLAQRVAASHGLDVVEIEYHGSAKHRALRIFIEKNASERARLAEGGAKNLKDLKDLKLPENLSVDQLAGITVEDCERFSLDFGTVLDVEELVPGDDYMLEVSSPGLDRKLRGREDYRRFTGNLVKVQTFEPIAGNRHWQGRIAEVDADNLVLDLGEAKKRKRNAAVAAEKTVSMAFTNIEKANLVPEI